MAVLSLGFQMKTKDMKKEPVCTKHNTNRSMHKQHSPSVEHGFGFRKVRMVPIILFTSLRHLLLHILNLDSNTYIEKHHNNKPYATSVLFYATIQRQHKHLLVVHTTVGFL
jgi:hypothetical protein